LAEAKRTDRQQVIEWLEEDLAYYKKNIGKLTEFDVLITEDLIDFVTVKLRKLKERENDNNGRLSKVYI
jgi:ABC-type Zn2+ transport system substrate-binding protein/surface adhesin